MTLNHTEHHGSNPPEQSPKADNGWKTIKKAQRSMSVERDSMTLPYHRDLQRGTAKFASTVRQRHAMQATSLSSTLHRDLFCSRIEVFISARTSPTFGHVVRVVWISQRCTHFLIRGACSSISFKGLDLLDLPIRYRDLYSLTRVAIMALIFAVRWLRPHLPGQQFLRNLPPCSRFILLEKNLHAR